MQTIKEQIGDEAYVRLEEEANKEVSLAMQMELLDQYKQEKYYRRRQLLTHLLSDFETFQNKGLRISPIDVVYVLFEAKLLHACSTEHEYDQRRGGGRFMEEVPFLYTWAERSLPINEIIDEHFKKLDQSISDRTLVTEITNFNTHSTMGSASEFLKNLFLKLELPFEAHFEQETTEEENNKLNGGEYKPQTARISFTTSGSEMYVYFYAQAYLRTFLNMLRIAGFLYKGQIDFGMWKVQIMAPTTPFFLTPNTMGGVFSWEEDKKKPWEKIPDGCLFLSFGYRGITTLFLDDRTFAGIEKFFIENKIIFDRLKNPWSKECINDIIPSLDIISSATQTPDLGAKILQIYCCLEHLFVPKNIKRDNVKYIIGAINALRSDLYSWFEKLYQVRCNYAHKGFVQRDDKTLALVFESTRNSIVLLTEKLRHV